MDRTRTVQDVQAGMARAEAAAQGIARSARQLPQWGSQGGAHAINTGEVARPPVRLRRIRDDAFRTTRQSWSGGRSVVSQS